MALLLAGSKIRERRKSRGMTQTDLAAQIGISASYLNLIEANRRNIGGALLKRVADALGVPIDAFDGAAQRRLVDEVALIAADPMMAPLDLAPASAAGLVSSPHSGWARALVSLHRAYLDRNEAVNALSDRLNQDPVLGDAVHSMLTHVTAIRSASEILESDGALDDGQRQRFVDIIANDSRRLSDVSLALAGLFTKSETMHWPITPAEQIDDFLAENDNHFPALEQAAAQLREAAGLHGGDTGPALIGYLARMHGVTLRAAASQSGAPVNASSPYDPISRTLVLSERATESSRRFRLAQLCAELGAQGAIDAQIDASACLASAQARLGSARVLASYIAGAMLMPYAAFQSAAIAARYDIDRLGDLFHTSFEQVCHRLVTLRRPGAEGVRFGFMRCDPAGRIRKRLVLPQWPQPRHGPACPLWAVYEAFRSPGTTVRQLAEFPRGDRYLLIARAVQKQHAVYGMPRHVMSVMLVCHAMFADQMVYGDGLDVSADASAVPVGPACRVCVRQNCSYRQEDAIVGGANPSLSPSIG